MPHYEKLMHFVLSGFQLKSRVEQILPLEGSVAVKKLYTLMEP
jgi:hypothetical protein